MDNSLQTADKPLFDRRAVVKLILPLIIEQFLGVAIGLADTMMVSSVSEAAMSAVSVVDSVNLLLITIFSALATGGAIITSRHIGSGEKDLARKAASQLVTAVAFLSVILSAVTVILNKTILTTVYGALSEDVLAFSMKYFFWSAMSYPFIAVFNAGAAILRSQGRSSVTMYVSAASNIINVAGNAILIYVFDLDVVGAAIASLISRAAGAVVTMYILSRRNGQVYFSNIRDFIPDIPMILRILRIGVPTGLENGMFQIGKILVQGIVTLGGTSSIAANSAANSLASVLLIPPAAVGLGLVTISGQCLGAGRVEETRAHTKRLVLFSNLSVAVLGTLLLIFRGPVFYVFNLSPETTQIANVLITTYCIVTMIMWPEAFVLPNTLRAAGDVRFTMMTSVISMWTARIGLSYIFFYFFHLGTLSVWLAMYCDWIVRVALFIPRFMGKKWLSHKV
ncbi:MAG: MATE family efflux transporter [Ruminococcaceae bacterium]|nr:MATE family efflux transporter [Oscillospiraceae bacterium]